VQADGPQLQGFDTKQNAGRGFDKAKQARHAMKGSTQ